MNECWLSDRDRFSYEGLYHEERITEPMIKQDNKWIKVDWETAINYCSKSLKGVINDHGTSAVGALASPSSTTEELYLLQKLMRVIGVNNIDSRLSRSDFSLDGKESGTSYFGTNIEELANAKSIFVVGSVLREEQPLLAHRIRTAVKKGAKLNYLNVLTEDLLCNVDNQITRDPREIAYFLAQVLKVTGCTDLDLSNVEVSTEATAVANSIKGGFIVIGEVAKSLPNYSEVLVLANHLAKTLEAKLGVLSGRSNEVGASLVGFVPTHGVFGESVKDGLNVSQMLNSSLKAYVLLNTELEQDVYNADLALKALKNSQSVIVMSAYVNEKMKEYADVILPITPFTETAGSYVNMYGTWQKFNGVTKPLGDAKPGWKVIRVLANQLVASGFDYNNIEEVRSELSNLEDSTKLLNNELKATVTIKKPTLDGLVRFGIQGMYNIDSITRRSHSLQETYHAKLPVFSVNQKLADKLELDNSAYAVQNANEYKFNLAISNDIPETVVLLASTQSTSNFAGRYDAIELKKDN